MQNSHEILTNLQHLDVFFSTTIEAINLMFASLERGEFPLSIYATYMFCEFIRHHEKNVKI